VSSHRYVTLLARRRVLPPGELRCAAVKCYRRQQTSESKVTLASYTMFRRASNNWKFLASSAYSPDRLAVIFLPRDAMHARYMLSSCVRLSVWHTPVLYESG